MKIRFAVLAAALCCALGSSASGQSASPVSVRDAAGFKILSLKGNNVRWYSQDKGQQPVVTYRLAGEEMAFPGAINCRKLKGLDELLAASGVSADAAKRELAAAFAMWEAVAGISFHEALEGAPADIVIGAQVEPEGQAFADVFYDTASSEPIKPLTKALVCLNPKKPWKIGFTGDLGVYDLRYTFAHEIGHAIGLDHPAAAGQIMGFRYEENFRQLQAGDIAGAIALYGRRRDTDIAIESSRRRP